MILPIVQIGDPGLRQETRRLSAKDIGSDDLRATVAAMRETMLAAPGVGLAAPQVGLDLRLAVLQDRADHFADDPDAVAMERRPLPFTVMINASFEPLGTETREFFEGCLSMIGYRALVRRYARVHARWTDLDGVAHEQEFSGWSARIVQHELDHLDGILYVDRCSTRSLTTLDNLDSHWSDLPIEKVREALRVEG